MVQENNKFIEGDYVTILDDSNNEQYDIQISQGVITDTLPGNQYRINHIPANLREEQLEFCNIFQEGDIVRFRRYSGSSHTKRELSLSVANGFTALHPFPMLVTKTSGDLVQLNDAGYYESRHLEKLEINQAKYGSRGDILKEIERLTKMAIDMFDMFE